MAKRIAARNGIMDLVYSCREQSRIVLTVYILIPTGGVFTPMVTMTHMRSPRCTGSIPTDWQHRKKDWCQKQYHHGTFHKHPHKYQKDNNKD